MWKKMGCKFWIFALLVHILQKYVSSILLQTEDVYTFEGVPFTKTCELDGVKDLTYVDFVTSKADVLRNSTDGRVTVIKTLKNDKAVLTITWNPILLEDVQLIGSMACRGPRSFVTYNIRVIQADNQPVLTIAPKTVALIEKSTASFICSATMNYYDVWKTFKIDWYRNGQPIIDNDTKHVIRESNDSYTSSKRSSLAVRDVQKNDGGVYTCTAHIQHEGEFVKSSFSKTARIQDLNDICTESKDCLLCQLFREGPLKDNCEQCTLEATLFVDLPSLPLCTIERSDGTIFNVTAQVFNQKIFFFVGTNYKSACQEKENGAECSRRGLCVFNECTCDLRQNPAEYVYGKYCQCDNFSCPRYRQLPCGGPSRGTCECGKCKCHSGFTGENCGSNVCSTASCTKNDLICSGHGQCSCDQCDCDKGYAGTFCETCVSCPEKCSIHKDCVECQLFEDAEPCDSPCDLRIRIVDKLTDDDPYCLMPRRKNDELFKFSVQFIGGVNLVLVERKKGVSCLVNNKTYTVGETFIKNCQNCVCLINGQTECNGEKCKLTVGGDILLPPTFRASDITRGSCLRMTIKEEIQCEDCKVPNLASLKIQNPLVELGNKIPFQVTLVDPDDSKRYVAEAVLNLGWCKRDGDVEWIRDGDYHNDHQITFVTPPPGGKIKLAVFLSVFHKEKECPKGTPIVVCTREPCAQTMCASNPEAICKPNYCGGCFQEWFVGDKKVECEKTECVENCPYIYDEKCGIDGKTYVNKCTFQVAQCKDPSLFLKSETACRPPTECETKVANARNVPGEYIPQCHEDGTYLPEQCHHSIGYCWCVDTILGNEIYGTRKNVRDGSKFVCRPPCLKPCSRIYRPICGSDGRTYGNECEFENGKCENPKLKRVSVGACPKIDPQSPQVGSGCPGVCLTIYDPQCGNDGKTYGNKCELESQRRCKDSNLRLAHPGKCKDCRPLPEVTCTANPCSQRICIDKPNAVCKPNLCGKCSMEWYLDGKPITCKETKCPQGCPFLWDPMCGNDGKTYSNKCTLEVAQCQDKSIYLQNEGPCVDKTECQKKQQEARGLPGEYVAQCGKDGHFEKLQCHPSTGHCWCVESSTGREIFGTRKPSGSKVDCSAPCVKPCTREYKPVCGSNGQTYSNKCEFNNAKCKDNELYVRNLFTCVDDVKKRLLAATPKLLYIIKGKLKFSPSIERALPPNSCLTMSVKEEIYCDQPPEAVQVECNIKTYAQKQIKDITLSRDGSYRYQIEIEAKDTLPNVIVGAILNIGWCMKRDKSPNADWLNNGDYINMFAYSVQTQKDEYVYDLDMKLNKHVEQKPPKPVNCAEHVSTLKSKNSGSRPLLGAFTPQCDEAGDYENKQCHGSTGYCWCVDKKTGHQVKGTKTRGKLQCGCTLNGKYYKPGQNAYDECNSCFCSTSGVMGCNIKACERGVCYHEGNIYKNGETYKDDCNTCTCSVRSSDEVGKFACTIKLCPKDSPLSCKEKLAALKSKNGGGRPLLGAFTPQCDELGEYRNKQCHGSTGYCWCVDKITGNEIEGTRKRGSLECGCTLNGKYYKPGQNAFYECNSCFCSKTGVMGCTLIGCRTGVCYHNGKSYQNGQSYKDDCNTCTCSVRSSEEVGKFTCTLKLCPKETELTCKDKVDALKSKNSGGRPLLGAFTPQCDEAGDYINKQCHGSTGYCWCVDTKTGTEVQGTRKRGSLECGCMHNNKYYKVGENYFDECNSCKCTPTGHSSCTAVDCEPGKCYHNGLAYGNGEGILDDCNTCTCTVQGENSDWTCTEIACINTKPQLTCKDMLNAFKSKIVGGRPILGASTPQCDEAGDYKSKQCHGSTGYCWCVDPKTGTEILGTRKRGRLDCDCEKPCPRIHKPVCGSDGLTYPNECVFNNAKCKDNSLTIKNYFTCQDDVKDAGEDDDDNKRTTKVEIEGRIIFSPPIKSLPVGSCIKYSVSEDILCDETIGCNIPKHAEVVDRNPKLEEDGSYEYELEFKTDRKGHRLSLGAHVNMGWCGSGNRWLRSGDYLNKIQHSLSADNLDGGEKEFDEDINVEKYTKQAKCLTEKQGLEAKEKLVGRFVPQCDDDTGLYKNRQCHSSTGYCWCVNTESGEKIKGTERRGMVNCGCTHSGFYHKIDAVVYDECNTCTCQSNGQMICTLIACPRGVCYYQGKAYQKSESLKVDCNRCMCSVPDESKVGFLGCTRKACVKSSEDSRESCDKPCQRISKPVCGSDGRTYPNECEFNNAKCKDNSLTIKNYFTCQDDMKRFTLTGDVRLLPGMPGIIPKGSCLKVSVKENRYCDEPPEDLGEGSIHCNIPIIAAETFRNPTPNKDGRLEYTIKFNVQRLMGINIDATLNIGSCRSGNDWLKDGDFTMTTSHAFDIESGNFEYNKDLSLEKYEIKVPTCLEKLTSFKRRNSNQLVGAYTPQCDEAGDYTNKQCHGSTGYCWCVDTKTGKEIEGTKKRGVFDCGCTHNGKYYNVDESAFDECNSCICQATGVMSCTKIGCQQGVCYYRGNAYKDGETYKDDCNTCTCQVSNGRKGIFACSEKLCDVGCVKPCQRISKPVCGSDGQTYSNECEFRNAKCKDASLTIKNYFRCQDDLPSNIIRIFGKISFLPKVERPLARGSCIQLYVTEEILCSFEDCKIPRLAESMDKNPMLNNDGTYSYELRFKKTTNLHRLIIEVNLFNGHCGDFKSGDYRVDKSYSVEYEEGKSEYTQHINLAQYISPEESKTKALCQRKREEANSNTKLLGQFVPECDEQGLYKNRQCHRSTGYCFCVNTETGVKIPGTEKRGLVQCGCTYKGVYHEHGSKVYQECNECQCSNGNLACTRKFCPKGVCYYNGQMKQHVESFLDAEGCNTCLCSVFDKNDYGSVGCTLKFCPKMHRLSFVSGRIILPKGAAMNLEKSCLSVRIQEERLCVSEECDAPIIESFVRKGVKLEKPNVIAYKMPFDGEAGTRYVILATLNVNWCKSGDDWIRPGDYHSATSYSLEGPEVPGKKFKIDIDLEKYKSAPKPLKPVLNEIICPRNVPQVACTFVPCQKLLCNDYPTAVCKNDFCGTCAARFFVDGREVKCRNTKCSRGCPLNYDPHCGSDDVTYSNECTFFVGQCENNKLILKNKGICYDKSLTVCQNEARSRTNGPLLIGRFVPQCEDDGSYKKIQCHGSTGYCWCVDKDGTKVEGTDKAPGDGRPNCYDSNKSKEQYCLRACTFEYDPVCASNGQTMANECVFKYEQCKNKKLTMKKGQCNGCPPGVRITPCFANPCDVSTCPAYPDARCQGNYCGGCNAEYFVDDKKVDCVIPEVTPRSFASAEKAVLSGQSVSCSMVCTTEYSPVCGSDGKTHSNLCAMKMEGCIKRTNIFKVHDGECGNCRKTCTLEYDAQCGSDGKIYANRCLMKLKVCQSGGAVSLSYSGECGNPTCPRKCDKAKPEDICGTDGKTYDSLCEMQRESCNTGSVVKFNHYGKCVKCSAFCKKNWDPYCGTDGQTYSNECMMNYGSCRSGGRIRVKHRGECNQPSCPLKCPKLRDRVCGTDGRTYSNLCTLQKATCKNKDTILNHHGPCADRCRFYKRCRFRYAPVCGSNGKTYVNHCQLRKVMCVSNGKVNKAYNGKCKTCPKALSNCVRNPCEGTFCPNFPKAKCVANYCGGCNAEFYFNGRRIYNCGKKCSNVCNKEYFPLCGNDGHKYSNKCLLNYASCKSNGKIKMAYYGPCKTIYY